MEKIIPSPNYDDRPQGAVIDTLVLHYTGMPDCQSAMDRLCDEKFKVSSHYVVDEDGTAYQLVDETKRAWHAGVSQWRGRERVNDFSIGIELVNPGHEFGYRPFTDSQMKSLVKLCRGILSRHPIPARNVVAHSDIAPSRKEDPGELFDWRYLAAEGIGLWPESSKTAHTRGDSVKAMQQALASYGYDITVNGVSDAQTGQVVRAFQRHFNPAHMDGAWKDSDQHILEALLIAVAR